MSGSVISNEAVTSRLIDAFARGCGCSLNGPTAVLQAALAAQLAACRAAWPTVTVDEEAAVADWGQRLAAQASDIATIDADALANLVAALPAADFYIALACASPNSGGIAAFEAFFFPQLDAAVARAVIATDDINEVRQALRAQLFLTESDQPPPIVALVGRGDLAGLVRVMAIRAALKLRRSATRRAGLSANAAMAQSFADNPANPELQAIREQQRSMLKDAVETAIAALPIHDRTVLRMSIVDNLPIDDIGRAFDVHRATAARWLERIRVELRTATMRALRSALASPQHEAELTSICRALDSQLAISFPRLLAS